MQSLSQGRSGRGAFVPSWPIVGLPTLLVAATAACTGGAPAEDAALPDLGADIGFADAWRPPDAPRPDLWPDLPADMPVDRQDAAEDAGVDRGPDGPPPPPCGDGTPVGQCSAELPYLCNTASKLEARCSICGCPGFLACNAQDQCEPSVLTLHPVADTYDYELEPDTNYGDSAELLVGSHCTGVFSCGAADAHIRFDLAQLPPTATIDKAELRVTVFAYSPAASLPWAITEVLPIKDAWTEMGLTWNNRPAVHGSPSKTGLILTGPRTIDVKAHVEHYLSMTYMVYGLRLGITGGNFKIYSREWGTVSERPTLVVTYR